MAIHSRLSVILGEKRIKMLTVAKETGLAYSTVNNFYNDKVSRVDYSVLDKLCEYLDCQPGDLLAHKNNAQERSATN